MHDLVVKGGWIVDGSGGPMFRGDLGIDADRVAAVGSVGKGARTIDATGHLVAPGFVDMHAHSDLQLLDDPGASAKVMQGVVTEVLGQDGLSFAPADGPTLAAVREQTAAWNGSPETFEYDWETVGEYLDKLQGARPSVNAAYLIPHGTVRLQIVGQEDRAATGDELAAMRAIVRHGMEDGALGLSTGLTYTPAMYAPTDELVALCEEIAPYGGYFSPHTRSYGKGIMRAYAEVIEISRQSGAPLHLTHCQISFPGNEGRSGELFAMIDELDPREIEVTADSYCYTPGSTYLAAFLPTWAWQEGVDGVITHLESPEDAERIRVELEEIGTDGFHGALMDWSKIQIGSFGSGANPQWVGLRMSEVAAEMGVAGWEAARRLMIDERLDLNILTHVGHEDNVRAIMMQPYHMGSTDGIMVGDKPHPRAWGTFARYLAHYTRELGMFTWPEIIRKLSSLPNLRLRQFDRGLLRPGFFADVVVFDPDAVSDSATFDEPKRHPAGMPHVVVNGTPVKVDGVHTGAGPGRILRNPGRA